MIHTFKLLVIAEKDSRCLPTFPSLVIFLLLKQIFKIDFMIKFLYFCFVI